MGGRKKGWHYCEVTHPPALDLPRLQRALAALGVVVAVLVLHAAVLGRLPRASGAPGAVRPPVPTLQVRQRWLPQPPTARLPAAQPVPAQTLTPPAGTAPRRAPRAARPPAAALATAHAAAATTPAAVATTPGAAAADSADAGPPAAPAVAGGPPLPVYATRLPPPFTLQYTVRQAGPGRAGLQAELRWRPLADRYTLTMGYAAAGWASVGGLDGSGVAPERHVETRAGREVRAVNFQRGAHPAGPRITFSGPSVEYPLPAAAQDRLSWMLQLSAVLAADPALAEPGREVQLFVAGVRGDAAVWTFGVVERGALELPAGTVADAVHLHREPQRPYDTRVDVWLDPARHHLPVRLRLQDRGDGPGTDFLLTDLGLP